MSSPRSSPRSPVEESPMVPGTLEAEEDGYQDSGLDDGASIASSTTSLLSSRMRSREENGRTYHSYKEGKYSWPNDESEQDRLDMQHQLIRLTLDKKLYLAPLGNNVHRALDAGCGTGIWAIDFAYQHPETEVIGIDLSSIQPMLTAPNCSFQVDDLEEPWTFTHKFDFINVRMMTGSFANWPRFFEQCYQNLNPGGYIELCDICLPVQCDDGTMPDDNLTKVHFDLILEATKKIGRDGDSASRYKSQLEEAGFTDPVQQMFRWPLNSWQKDRKHKEIGLWTYENYGGGLSGISMALFTRVLGWSKEETEVQVAMVRKDMRNTKVHSYVPVYVIYAQKPKE